MMEAAQRSGREARGRGEGVEFGREGGWEGLAERSVSRETARNVGRRALEETAGRRTRGEAAFGRRSSGEVTSERPTSTEVASGERAPRMVKAINNVRLSEEDFADIYSARQLAMDRAYVAERQRDFAETPQTRAARAFEDLFVRGVQVGRWLGNVPDERGGVAFTTRTHETTKYDDYLHRVDAFTVLQFQKPVETESGPLEMLPLGFDVTIGGHPETILDKMTRSYNDSAELPFGFSHLKYYTDGRTKSELAMLPRYVIGVGMKEARDFAGQMKDSAPKLLSAPALRMRFKTLAEIRAQNELFQAMLPDEVYDTEDEKLCRAQAYIEAADEQLNKALAVCANEMVKRRYLPKDVLERVEEASNPFKTRKIIEDFLMEESRERFREKWHGKADENLDPFLQIMTCARELTEAAYDEKRPRRKAAIDARRRVMAQNEKLVLPKAEG